MDVENFTQCLNYLSTVAKPNSPFEKILPIVTTVFGIFFGYILNHIRDRSKEIKTANQKRQCITEDVGRVKDVAKRCIKEALLILGENMSGKVANGHSMPARAEPTLIHEYFAEVAHTYTTLEREKILHMLDLASSLTERTTASRLKYDNAKAEFIEAHNTLTHAVFCYAICEAILENKEPEYDQLFKIADKYNFNSAYLEAKRNKEKAEPQPQPN